MSGRDRPPEVENMAERDPEEHAAGFRVHGNHYVEVMEMEGQQQLVASSWLPAELSPAVEQALLEQGVTLGSVMEADPLFREATLPVGWSRVPSPRSSVWSYLVDEQGHRRFRVFYKASYHDRRAHVTIASDDDW